MTGDVKSIVQLTRSDIRQIAAATNMKSGTGIKVVLNGESVSISIDELQFKRMVYSFCRQAWPSSCLSGPDIDAIDLGAEIT